MRAGDTATSVAAPSELLDVLGAVGGDRPVRDRSMPAEAERLLREWFAAPEAVDPDPDPDPDPDAGDGAGAVADVGPTGHGSGTAAAAAWSAPLRDLVSAVAAVRAQVPVELPGPQAVAEAEVLLEQLEVLRSVVLTRIADVDVRTLHTLADAASTSSWLDAQQTSLTRGEVAFARRLAAFPVLAAAVEDGVLSVAGAGRVAAALVKARPHLDRPDGLVDGQPGEATIAAVVVDGVLTAVCQARAGLEDRDPLVAGLLGRLEAIAGRPSSQLDRLTDGLVVLATSVEPGQLPGALGLLLDALLPDELERRAEQAHDHRGLRLRRKDDGSGWLVTRGDLDLECGELLQTVLDAERAVDPDGPDDTAAWAAARHDGDDGDSTCAPPRSLDQQRHDALRNGLRRYLDSGIAGLRGKVAPHLSVTVGLDSLHAAPGSLPAVAASGARLPRSLVRRWWCDSAVTRFVLGLGGKVLAASHTGRTLTATERRAKRIETGGGCEVAGCARGPGCRLVPHHPTPFAECGTTSLSDTVLICESNHRDLHVGRRVLRLKDGRRLGPDGWLPEEPDTG